MLDFHALDTRTRALLAAHGFDSLPFRELADRLKREGIDPNHNRTKGAVALPPRDALTPLPARNGPEGARLCRLGESAIRSNEVGVVVLNGGMATRFGGVPKGVLPAVDGRSFLDLKLSQVALASAGRAPVLLMNSFATASATADHLASLRSPLDVRQFTQFVSLRLTPEGGIFLEADGRPSLHAPGHGDLPFALRRSSELERFMRGGGRYLTVSNVDNLGAALDPLVIGAHIDRANPMTVELVETFPGDVGGFPALVDGRLMIMEAFRAPASFDIGSIPVFNTNTFVFDAAALARDVPLDWFIVTKTVDGRTAVQFERLAGQLSEHMDVTWLCVPRRGPESRFIPIKVQADLEKQAEALQAALGFQGVL